MRVVKVTSGTHTRVVLLRIIIRLPFGWFNVMNLEHDPKWMKQVMLVWALCYILSWNGKHITIGSTSLSLCVGMMMVEMNMVMYSANPYSECCQRTGNEYVYCFFIRKKGDLGPMHQLLPAKPPNSKLEIERWPEVRKSLRNKDERALFEWAGCVGYIV